MNKRKNLPITEYDLKKFEAIQNLVGLSIDNTSEQHSIVNVRLGVYSSLKGLSDIVKETQANQDEQSITNKDLDNIRIQRRNLPKKIADLENKIKYM